MNKPKDVFKLLNITGKERYAILNQIEKRLNITPKYTKGGHRRYTKTDMAMFKQATTRCQRLCCRLLDKL